MKKILSILMVITVLFAFSACSNQNSEKEKTQNGNTVSDEQNVSENASMDNMQTNNGKTLVVYFSASGNTKDAAEYIAKTLKADLFELEPVDEYSDDDLNWRDENSRVNYEHDNENARNIKLVSQTVNNWESYDTVFIGYPIWWGVASWVVDGFVENNDFSGKNVVPFCTSASSGLGESGTLLEEMAGSGNWLEGKRFSENVSETEIISWIDSLDI